MNFFIDKQDFRSLKKVVTNNKKFYNNKKVNAYDTKEIELFVSGLKKPIREKFEILKTSIIEDSRFANFEVGLATIRPRGFRFTPNYWLWMVNKKEYNKLQAEQVGSPQVHLPQVQISINREEFITAELWFEKNSYEKRIEFFDKIKNKIDELRTQYDIFLFKDLGNYKYITISTRDGASANDILNSYRNKINYPEAGVNKFLSIDEAENYGEGLIDKIKNDLFYLIQDVYEPVYGEILDNSFAKILGDKKLRNEDDVVRKGTEDIVYERKHSKMQNRFKKYYISRDYKVHIEKNRIDAILQKDNIIKLVEMKPYDDVKRTIREALGQIIGYKYIYNSGENENICLVIAGTGKPDREDLLYIEYLKKNIKFNFKYLYFDYKSKILRPEFY